MMRLKEQQVGQRTYYLDVARVIAIISITLNHAVNRAFENYNGQMAEYLSIPLYLTIIKAVITVFSHVGVPLFLMITGVLILNKPMENGEDVRRFYKHNVLSLFITAEIWYLIMYWVIVLLDPTNMILENEGIVGAIQGMARTMLFLEQTTFGSMWYMPMILCLYTTIPFVIMVKDKLGGFDRSILLPALLVFATFMVLPAVNYWRLFQGESWLHTKIREPNLFSFYYLYVIAGYAIGKGALQKWKDWVVILLAVGLFGLCCSYQFYAYTQPRDYLIDYEFPLLLLCGAFTFEWIRRKAGALKGLCRPVTYLSRISLGVYFLHIVIMSVLGWSLKLQDWSRLELLAFFEIASVGGSILVIALLSMVKPLKKCLFLIK